MRQKENRPGAGDAYGTVPNNCINDITDMCESQSIAYDDLLEAVTLAYLSDIDTDLSPDFSTVKVELLEITNDCIEKYNLGRPDENVPPTAKKSERYPDAKKPEARYRRLTALHPLQIAILIRELHHGVGILWNKAENEGNFDIGIYQTDGENEGCYDTRDETLERLIRSYDKTMSLRGVNETVAILRSICKRVERCSDRDLIPVNNGIFDYGSKVLLGFDPEYVFTSKSKVDFVPNAQNPVIHNDDDGTDWDVVSWMNELSDDPEVVDLLWEVMGATIRPAVNWNKTAWFYSTSGNNGKGTLCTLIRNLCGRGTWASVPLKAFSQQFMLEPLCRVSAIITDENDTGTFVDDAAALKSVITHDPFQINRKFKDPRTLMFHGFMIQCVNEFPKLKDKSESMYRRLLVIPFEKRFEGHERKYIKNDYLHRREVLEYVLYRLLYETDYYELSIPQSCKDMLADFKTYNDPIRQFCEEVLSDVSWDLLPWDFAYDLYCAWMQKNQPSGRPIGKYGFKKDLAALLSLWPEWSCTENAVRSQGHMDCAEPLILKYELRNWMNHDYRGSDPMRVCQPEVKERYRGLLRDKTAAVPAYMVSGETTTSKETNSD